MKKVLVVVDMQKDFVDGALGTAEAQAILPHVAAKIQAAQAAGYEVIFTRDTHEPNYLETQEGHNLPVVHCVRGTEGWQICEELTAGVEASRIFDKVTFGSRELAEALAQEEVESVEFIGVCTDICVISNALLVKAFMPEVLVSVDASCCAGVTPASHDNALAAMKMCQITVTGE